MSASAYTMRPAPARPKAAPGGIAACVAAAVCAWVVYADPPARHLATEALQPLLSAVLPAPPPLKFGEVRARRGEINGQPVLYVEGSLVNAENRRRKAPALLLTLTGDDDRPIYSWDAKPARAELEASGVATFQTRLLAPPSSFKAIVVSLKGG